MKRALIIGLAFGLGVGLALGLGFGVVLLGRAGFASWREAHPLPWNTTAITAAFDYIDAEGSDNKLVFCYILENHTDLDFRMASPSDISVLARLRDQNSLVAGHPGETIARELPLFLPARERVRFRLHLGTVGYSYEDKKPLPSDDGKDRDERHRALAAYVSRKLPNVAGFALFHEGFRYQIELPKGW